MYIGIKPLHFYPRSSSIVTRHCLHIMHIVIHSYPPFVSATCLQHARFEDVHDVSLARAYTGRR